MKPMNKSLFASFSSEKEESFFLVLFRRKEPKDFYPLLRLRPKCSTIDQKEADRWVSWFFPRGIW
jgi:hypothetical protein